MNDPQMLDSARAVGVHSYVYFAWDASGFCSRVYVQQSSSNEVEKP